MTERVLREKLTQGSLFGPRERSRSETEPFSSWKHLVFGSYDRSSIAWAIHNEDWQAFRVSLLHERLCVKRFKLENYVNAYLGQFADPKFERHLRHIRVTNYVNALKRGGLVK